MKKKITILVPAYNESGSLPELIGKLGNLIAGEVDWHGVENDYEWEILVVDDGSNDGTPDLLAGLRASEPRLNYLSLSRNFGKENAMLAGMDYAGGDCVIIMDADLQHPVEAIPQMIGCWEEGYDDVYGQRLSRGKESFIRRKFSIAYYSLLQKSSGIDALKNVGDFRLLDRRCVDAIRSLRETQRNTKGLLCWIGYRKKGVPFETNDRQEGKSRFGFLKLVQLAVEGITGFTTAPLRFATLMGIVVTLAAFVYIVFILVKTIIWGEPVRGYPTMMCVILFLGGCQLLSLGIIGEYVGRIFNESKNRPPYIAESYNGEKIR